jgi:hypothetical protein
MRPLNVTRNSEASPGEEPAKKKEIVMIRRVWTSAGAGVALLSTAALLHAQQVPDKGSEPSARERSLEGKGQRAPAAQQQPGTDRPSATEPGRERSKGAERPDRDRPRTTDQPGRDQPKGAERPDRDRSRTTDQPDKDRSKGVERRDKDRPRTTDQPDKDRPKGAERPDKDRPRTTDQPDKDRPKGAERPDRDGPKGAERPDKTRPGMAQPDSDKSTSGRAQVSEQQRTEIRTKLRDSRVEKTRVQVNVNVGSRIPRSVRVHSLPSAIIALAPAYRGQSYFVRDDDTIVIVDSRTYAVVDVIPSGSGTRTAGLSLSPDQMRFIYARVPKDRSVDVRVRLGLGAEVPADVELSPFPPEVLARIPEVEGYRYVVANREVAIVDPKDNSIALVISE